MNLVSELDDAAADALLGEVIAAERRNQRLIQQIQVLYVLRESAFGVTRLVQSRCGFENQVGVLERFQALHDVGRLTALGAFYHEFVDIEWNQQNARACPVMSIATEAQIIVVHLLESRPILHARLTHAVEVILLEQVGLSLILLNLREDRTVVLRDNRARWDPLDCSQHDNVAVEVANHARIARVIEVSNSWIERTADESRSAWVVLAFVLKLGHFVGIELHELEIVIHERPDVIKTEAVN